MDVFLHKVNLNSYALIIVSSFVMVKICKDNYPYEPSGDNEKCPVCGHTSNFHVYQLGKSICYKCDDVDEKQS